MGLIRYLEDAFSRWMGPSYDDYPPLKFYVGTCPNGELVLVGPCFGVCAKALDNGIADGRFSHGGLMSVEEFQAATEGTPAGRKALEEA